MSNSPRSSDSANVIARTDNTHSAALPGKDKSVDFRYGIVTKTVPSGKGTDRMTIDFNMDFFRYIAGSGLSNHIIVLRNQLDGLSITDTKKEKLTQTISEKCKQIQIESRWTDFNIRVIAQTLSDDILHSLRKHPNPDVSIAFGKIGYDSDEIELLFTGIEKFLQTLRIYAIHLCKLEYVARNVGMSTGRSNLLKEVAMRIAGTYIPFVHHGTADYAQKVVEKYLINLHHIIRSFKKSVTHAIYVIFGEGKSTRNIAHAYTKKGIDGVKSFSAFYHSYDGRAYENWCTKYCSSSLHYDTFPPINTGGLPARYSVKPITKPVVEPVSKHIAKPVVEPVSKHIAKPVVESVSKHIAKPVVEPVSKPITKPVVEPVLATGIIAPTSKSSTDMQMQIVGTLADGMPIFMNQFGQYLTIVNTLNGMKMMPMNANVPILTPTPVPLHKSTAQSIPFTGTPEIV